MQNNTNSPKPPSEGRFRSHSAQGGENAVTQGRTQVIIPPRQPEVRQNSPQQERRRAPDQNFRPVRPPQQHKEQPSHENPPESPRQVVVGLPKHEKQEKQQKQPPVIVDSPNIAQNAHAGFRAALRVVHCPRVLSHQRYWRNILLGGYARNIPYRDVLAPD